MYHEYSGELSATNYACIEDIKKQRLGDILQFQGHPAWWSAERFGQDLDAKHLKQNLQLERRNEICEIDYKVA